MPATQEFDGRVALVTGAAGGIGRATAQLFASRGARVVAADRHRDGVHETVAHIVADGGDAVAVVADLSTEPAVKEIVAAAVKHYGGLDIAHNNAGINAMPVDITELSLERWNHTLTANLTSMFLCLKHEVRAMRERKGGAIVNMSSIAGVVMFPGVPDYVTSKHGVLGLTKTVANDLASEGIRVNAVCPGSTDTPMLRGFISDNPEAEDAMRAMVPMGRLGQPTELAEAVLWLCSDRASFVTGATLLVDGGTVGR